MNCYTLMKRSFYADHEYIIQKCVWHLSQEWGAKEFLSFPMEKHLKKREGNKKEEQTQGRKERMTKHDKERQEALKKVAEWGTDLTCWRPRPCVCLLVPQGCYHDAYQGFWTSRLKAFCCTGSSSTFESQKWTLFFFLSWCSFLTKLFSCLRCD